MKLLKYKVTEFRSVSDSGWINCDDVTTLVGINESGKSNLLLALWKLNPAFGGEIDVLHDLPVSKLAEMRNQISEVCFIEAQFALSEESAKLIGDEVGCDMSEVKVITISRYYDGGYDIDLNGVTPITTLTEEKSETSEDGETNIKTTVPKDYDIDKLNDCIVKYMPKFVYYSNYGNLSTRIYLPNVIRWLNNEQVEGIDYNEDQVRTLRVLFKYVNLQPQEILDLGHDYAADQRRNGRISQDEIDAADKAKEKRSILLQSASTKLTQDFKEWWSQGNYKFRFEADGDYFRIWVSDEIRPAEVSLELRSTGLQWFLSFYLIFLVESQDNHKNAILLLDEAGLTLHPLAQKDLAIFFNKLSQTNQIINTTHSPFIVDTNNIDRCKVVYTDDNGYTVASDNLRQGNDRLNEKSIYAVHAALGLSVSDILLQGCKPIIVEGPSDQIYMNTIKQILISNKQIAPKDELIFVPSGGVRGIPGVVSILGSKNGELPFVIVDSDKSGNDAKSKLIKGNLYADDKDKILEVKEFVGFDGSEIEDLIPHRFIIKAIAKIIPRSVEDDFEDFYKEGNPIIPQIESFSREHAFDLDNGWKVDLAKKVKLQMLKNTCTEEELKKWKDLFSKFDPENK